MGLPAYAPELHAPAERLHYFHPFRISIASLAIVGGYLGLVFWLGGHSAGTTARTAILVPVLLFAVGRTFQPRTLSADATEIRWKKMLQPAQVVPRRDVVAVQYLTTAPPELLATTSSTETETRSSGWTASRRRGWDRSPRISGSRCDR